MLQVVLDLLLRLKKSQAIIMLLTSRRPALRLPVIVTSFVLTALYSGSALTFPGSGYEFPYSVQGTLYADL